MSPSTLTQPAYDEHPAKKSEYQLLFNYASQNSPNHSQQKYSNTPISHHSERSGAETHTGETGTLQLNPDSDNNPENTNQLLLNLIKVIREIPQILDSSESAGNENIPLFKGKKIAVVVPAYNEELLIGETLSAIPSYVARIYAVNDCSKDKTGNIIDSFAAQHEYIIPIHHEKNKGVGAAIVSGYQAALADGMDVVAVMAGDNQMDPEFLPELLDPVVEGQVDYTMGNRLINPEFRQEMSRWRFFGNSLLTFLTKIASGYWQMMDPQNGYTAISSRALSTIPLEGIYPRYGYCNDLLVRLNVWGFRVKNVPHPARYGREKSGIRYRTYITRLSRLLLTDFLWRLKMKYIVLSFHPLVFYYSLGMVITGISVLAGFYTMYYKFIQGGAFFVPVVVTLLLFGLGAQFLFFAMLFDMQAEKNGGWY